VPTLQEAVFDSQEEQRMRSTVCAYSHEQQRMTRMRLLS
jgi:hypothetical protein